MKRRYRREVPKLLYKIEGLAPVCDTTSACSYLRSTCSPHPPAYYTDVTENKCESLKLRIPEGYWKIISALNIISPPTITSSPSVPSSLNMRPHITRSSKPRVAAGPSLRLTLEKAFLGQAGGKDSIRKDVLPEAQLCQNTTYWLCPGCGDMLCLRCRSHFHHGMSCQQYQALPEYLRMSEADRAVAEVLRQDGFQRCTKCKMMVELREGCHHIRCLCGHHFCYFCGGDWVLPGSIIRHSQCESTNPAARQRVLNVTIGRAGGQRDAATFQRAVNDMADQLRREHAAHESHLHNWTLQRQV
eukprot:jgi/Botrbrau1/16207/Bobra.314_2s0001.1